MKLKLFRNEEGQTLVFTAFLMCCLMGFMALAVDVSVLIRAQRRLQTAADAAAIAGALEYWYHGSSNVASVARTAASNNGVTDPTQVTVTPSPTNGWHTGASYLEVIIRQPNPTIFMGTFAGLFPGGASSFNPMTVATRAVAGITPAAACVYVTAPDGQSLTVKGGATVSSPGCAWQVDSVSPQALCVTGNNANASFDTAGVDLANKQVTSGNCNKLYPGADTSGSSFTDPLASTFSFPDPNNVCDNNNTVPSSITTVTSANLATVAAYVRPKTTGGFSTQANPISYNVTCFEAPNVTLSGVTLGSASDVNHLYLFKNGLVLSGNNTVYGTMDLNNGIFCQGTYNSSNGKCSWTSGGGQPSITMYAPSNGDPVDGTATDSNVYAMNGMAFIMPGTDQTTAGGSYCDNSYGGPNYSTNTYPTIPDACLQMQFGSGSGQITGMIYAPYSGLYIQDSGGTGIGVTSLIVGDIYINGTLNISANYSNGNPDSPLNHVSLVE